MQFAASSSSCQISATGPEMQYGPVFLTSQQKCFLFSQQTELSKHISIFDNRHIKTLFPGYTFN